MTELLLTGAGIVGGAARGTALVTDVDLALSLIDPATGVIKHPNHPLFGKSVAGTVLVFPTGSGSSSGSYRLLHLSEQGTAPAAIVNVQANAVVTAGAVLGDIPLIHRLAPDPLHAIRSGDDVEVDATRGRVVIHSRAPV